MFTSITDEAPELRRLQDVVADLESKQHAAANRVGRLEQAVLEAHEEDLQREAAALNANRKPPKAKEAEVREQLEGAQRHFQVLGRRLTLAQADLASYVADNAEELSATASEIKAARAREVSELAGKLAQALHSYQLPDADRRALRPYLETPQAENTGKPQASVTVMGPHTRATAFGERVGGLSMGQLEAIATELSGLSARHEQDGVTVIGPTEHEGAA